MKLSVVFLCVFHCSYGIREEKFFAGVLCDLDIRIASKFSYQVTNIRNFNACVLGCSKDLRCVGASITNKTSCFHHRSCSTISSCTFKEEKHKYVSKNCGHGGVWNSTLSKCACTNGWVGEHCLDLPSDCLDLVTHGGYGEGNNHPTYLRSKPKTIPVKRLIPVICQVISSRKAPRINVFKNGGNGAFDKRTWEEYKHGFMVDLNNYWVGLENWHYLSLLGYRKLGVHINIGINYLQYNNFTVKDELQKFAFTFDSFTPLIRKGGSILNEFSDCFGPLQNSSFSTKDRDNDGVSAVNCAAGIGSGWWFAHNICSSSCNLLGKSPTEWDLIPQEQWMRVDGVDLNAIKEATSVRILAYIMNV